MAVRRLRLAPRIGRVSEQSFQSIIGERWDSEWVLASRYFLRPLERCWSGL